MRGMFKPNSRHNEAWLIKAYTEAIDSLNAIIEEYDLCESTEEFADRAMAIALATRADMTRTTNIQAQKKAIVPFGKTPFVFNGNAFATSMGD